MATKRVHHVLPLPTLQDMCFSRDGNMVGRLPPSACQCKHASQDTHHPRNPCFATTQPRKTSCVRPFVGAIGCVDVHQLTSVPPSKQGNSGAQVPPSIHLHSERCAHKPNRKRARSVNDVRRERRPLNIKQRHQHSTIDESRQPGTSVIKTCRAHRYGISERVRLLDQRPLHSKLAFRADCRIPNPS